MVHRGGGDERGGDRERERSQEHRGKRSGPPICTICDRPDHMADRCFLNPNCSSFKGKPSAKAVTFDDDRELEN